MDFKELYNSKLISVTDAAKMVNDGDWVDLGWAALIPQDFDKALAARVDELRDVKIRSALAYYPLEVTKADDTGEHIIYNSWFSTAAERPFINKNHYGAFHMPARYVEIAKFYDEILPPASVFVIATTPMDQNGNFNFGISVSHLEEVMNLADKVIVEVNENAPRVLGGNLNYVNIKDVDYIIESTNYPIPEVKKASFGEEELEVAKHIVEILRDGDCLQLGIGGLPNAIGSEMLKSDLKDLGVHSEMYVESYMELTKAGKINGKRKNRDKGRQTFAFAGGSTDLYEFMANNEEIMAAPVRYTNDVSVIASIDNFVSINTAVNIDLWGQVAAESIGHKHISGTGGALDFMIGAFNSKGGRSVVALTSSYLDKDGNRQSRIVPYLPLGTQITAPRTATHYVATEYGITNLKAKSSWQRTESLISISHPDLRDDLIKQADELGIWRNSNK